MKGAVRPYNNLELKNIRRTLRKNLTDHERILWSKLRNRQLEGFKFIRQYSIGHYVLDFYCPGKRVAVELDGGHHSESKQSTRDGERDTFLKSMNIRMLRFWNNEVKTNLYGVMETILQALKDT